MNIPFKTTDVELERLASIFVEMMNAGVDPAFLVRTLQLARIDQGVYDLMAMWSAADGPERDEIIADLQDSLDDYEEAPSEPLKKPYIKYDSLGDVAQQVTSRKAHLREIVDQHGGVSAVARKCGIPQPSLSRMLNSASMPRRSTLYKIANALDLQESDIVTEWTR